MSLFCKWGIEMYFELRMYKSAQGRMQDIKDRMRDHLPSMLIKHQFPWPLGQWECVAGSGLPLYIWMLQWRDLDHRSQCFGALYSDPEWERIRISTNGIRNTVVEQRILIMRHLPCQPDLSDLSLARVDQSTRLHELRIQRVQYGMLPAALKQMSQVDLHAWDRHGASILGTYEIISGAPIPSIAWFMSWQDFESRKAALARFESDPTVVKARSLEVDQINNHYLQDFDSYLLEPMPYCVPKPLLALETKGKSA